MQAKPALPGKLVVGKGESENNIKQRYPKTLPPLLTQDVIYKQYNRALFCQIVELARRQPFTSEPELLAGWE